MIEHICSFDNHQLELILDTINNPEAFEMLLESINNLSAGIQFLMYIALAFLLWKVISILGRLFGSWFLGGL